MDYHAAAFLTGVAFLSFLAISLVSFAHFCIISMHIYSNGLINIGTRF
jgi:hypothetical protein